MSCKTIPARRKPKPVRALCAANDGSLLLGEEGLGFTGTRHRGSAATNVLGCPNEEKEAADDREGITDDDSPRGASTL